MVTLPAETIEKYTSPVIPPKKGKAVLAGEFEKQFGKSRDTMRAIIEGDRQPNSPEMYNWLVAKIDEYYAYYLPDYPQRVANRNAWRLRREAEKSSGQQAA